MVLSDQLLALRGIFESTNMSSGPSRNLHNWFRSTENNSEYCSFTGVDCDSEGFVTTLRLGDLHLSGPFPDSINKLDQLTQLHLDNNFFSGTIPSFVSQMSLLQILNLGYNKFVGPIPELSQLTDLRVIRVQHNFLNGTIPSSLCSSEKLRVITVSGNSNLAGTIPSCLGDAEFLVRFDLHSTSLTGEIPTPLCLEREMNGFTPNRFGCDAIGCAAGTFQKLGGRRWNNTTKCEPCDSPSNVLGGSFCRWVSSESYPPSQTPTSVPSPNRGLEPSYFPSYTPSYVPSHMPSSTPSARTMSPVLISMLPTPVPSRKPSVVPVVVSTDSPTNDETFLTTSPSSQPYLLRGRPTNYPLSSQPQSFTSVSPTVHVDHVAGVSSQRASSSMSRRTIFIAGSVCGVGLVAFIVGLLLRRRSSQWRLNGDEFISEPSPRKEIADDDRSFTPSELYCIEEEGSSFEFTAKDEELVAVQNPILKSSLALPIRSWEEVKKRREGQRVRFDLPDDDDEVNSWVDEKKKQQSKSMDSTDTLHWALWIMNNNMCSSGINSIGSSQEPGNGECPPSPSSPSSDNSDTNSTTPILQKNCSEGDVMFGWDMASYKEVIHKKQHREPLLGITGRDLKNSKTSVVAYSEPAPEFLRDVSHKLQPSTPLGKAIESQRQNMLQNSSSSTVVSEETYHDVEDGSPAIHVGSADTGDGISLVEI